MNKAEERALRREMVETCRRMNSTGINQGTAGNLSIRLDEETFLITPSSLAYDAMTPDDIMKMGFDGTFEGRHRPSSEWRFHRDILRHRPDINVVLHCHSIYATTLAVHHKTIPSFHYMTGVAGGTTIRCARYATFGTQALSDAAIEALDGRLACLLGQHGQISLGKTFGGALWLANEVETISRMYVQALVLGEPPVLDDEEMARVIGQMQRMSYGQMPEPEGANDVARPKAPAKPARAAAKPAPAKPAPAKPAPAKTAPAKTAPAKTAPAKKATARKPVAKPAASRKRA